MVVLSMYFARSSAGTRVAVGAGVLVGEGVTVAVGINDAVGVTVDTGAGDAQEEKINVNTKSTRMDGTSLFRMG